MSWPHNNKHIYPVLLLSLGIVLTQCNAKSTSTTKPTTQKSTKKQVKVVIKAAPKEAAFPTQFPKPKSTPTSNHDFTSKHFSGSENCAFCHNNITDENDDDVSIETVWSSTMMANSTRDPLWRAKVETEIQRNPKHKKLLTDKCTRCHAPMANVEARKAKKPYDLFGSKGLFQKANPYFHQAMDGVSCTACHQIKPTKAMGTLAGFSGKYVIETFADAVDRKIYGPYNDVIPMPMQNHVDYTPTGSSHISDSKLCGSCHNLKTPFVDKNGKIIPKTDAQQFPEQMVYSEWKWSAYAKSTKPQTCQSCHMTPTSGVIISQRPPWLDTTRSHFGQHIFVGGNKFMLQMMKDNKQLLGISANNFDFTIKKTAQMLRSAARLEVHNTTFSKGTLSFTVRIVNQTGHKLPSGYPARRVFLQVKVRDKNNRVLFFSGKEKPFGEIEGVDADQDAKTFEPHHKVITKPSQVAVYEAIMQNTDKEVTYTLLRGAKYAKDNRLLPKGFDKEKAPNDIAVVGAAKTDKDFVGGREDIQYKIPSLPKGPYKIDINLRYQAVSYRFVRDLLKKPGKYAKQFAYLYVKSPRYSEPIASYQFSYK